MDYCRRSNPFVFCRLVWDAPVNNSSYFAKVWFVFSLTVLAFGYGFASHAWELFPKGYVERAWRQGYWLVQDRSVQDQNPAITFNTPRYDRHGTRIPKPEQVQPGLTLITSSWEGPDGWNPALRLFDSQGEMVHEWRLDREKVFQGESFKRIDPRRQYIHGSYFLTGGDLVANLTRAGMVKLDACSNILWELKEKTHHSIARKKDGSFWVPRNNLKEVPSNDQYPGGFPGLEEKKITTRQIINVSKRGKILERIRVLNIIYRSRLKRYIPKSLGSVKDSLLADLTHLNDVEPLDPSMSDEYPLFQAGDLLVSLRNLDLVFVFNPTTKEVKWHSSDPFIFQHDPDFIGDGWIGVFDNNYDLSGGELLGGSRIVALQPHTDSVEVKFPTERSEPFYTRVAGKWQLLDNGNLLLAESTQGRVVEVNPSGETVWEWIHEPIDSSAVPGVSKATRLDLTREEVASWPCSSVDSVGSSSKK